MGSTPKWGQCAGDDREDFGGKRIRDREYIPRYPVGGDELFSRLDANLCTAGPAIFPTKHRNAHAYTWNSNGRTERAPEERDKERGD